MTTTPEPTFDQNLAMIISQLPPQVRNFFISGKVEIVTQNLIQKYQLHIDQGAIIDRETILLLLGLKNLAEFSQTLATEAHLEKKIIENIVQDINTQIFVPLREEEMKGGKGSLLPTTPTVSAQSPAQPSSHFHLQNKITPASRLAQPSQPSMIAAPSPEASNTLLEDHEEPHIEFNKTPATPAPMPIQKASSPQSPLGEVLSRIIPPGGRPSFAPAPKTVFPTAVPPRVNPPQTLSGAVSPTVAPQFNRLPSVPKSTPSATLAPAAPKALIAPAKPYSTDPYREPIDEK